MPSPSQELALQKAAPARGSLFGDINNLRHAKDDEEDAEEKERAKFNEFTICGRLARNKHFEYTTLGVIVFNALYLGYDCDYGARWGKPDDLYASGLWGFILLDNCFCLFFTVELVVRFIGYKSKFQSCKDIPFLFDLALVVMMVAETWVLAFVGKIDALKQVSILRLLRLTRLLRMGKIMRYFPELQLIVKGMVAAIRSVGCATILLLLLVYVFAIIFTSEYHQGLKADDDGDLADHEKLFGSMGKSMRHLVIMGVILDDITACCNALRASGKIHMLMWFILLVLIGSFTIFNMLLGILCEVVENTQNGEQEKAETKKLNDTMLKFFKHMDLDGNGVISRNEFQRMSQDEEVMKTLASIDIKQAEFEKYAELLFAPKIDGGKIPQLDYNDAVAMIIRLRPGTKANRCDFAYFSMIAKQQNQEIMKWLDDVEALVDECVALDEEEEEPHNFTDTQALEDEAAAADAAKRAAASGRRPVMTISRLARSGAGDVAIAPTLVRRWSDEPELLAGEPSPRSARGKPAHADLVKERMLQMAEMRRDVKVNKLKEIFGEGHMTMASFHGAGPVNNNVVMPNNSPNAVYDDDEDDDYVPFSPNSFSLE